MPPIPTGSLRHNAQKLKQPDPTLLAPPCVPVERAAVTHPSMAILQIAWACLLSLYGPWSGWGSTKTQEELLATMKIQTELKLPEKEKDGKNLRRGWPSDRRVPKHTHNAAGSQLSN